MTTPRKNAANSAAALAASAALGSNLDDHVSEEFRAEELNLVPEKGGPAATPAKVVKAKPVVPPELAVKSQPRVWIVLEDNDDIPPGGQFIGVDGAAFYLVPGIEAWVPVGITSVLDAAVRSVPVLDEVTRQVRRWKQQLRFPYRVLHNKPAPEGWVQAK